IVQVLVSENDSTELIGVMIDMTQQKKIEEELIKAKDKAEEANRLKSSFLSTVSHEIRSPLNAILGFSSILKEIYYQNASDEDKQFFNSMEEAGVRLLETITQVLDISRLEADDFSVNIKPVSVSKAMVSAHSVLELQAKKKGLTIKLDLPREEIIIPTDEYCLGGVLVNLLSNAIKYSYKGEIILKLVDNKEYLECSVQDQGIGMSDEYKKHLFETFSQEDVGLSRRYEGTGLGLAITKRYLDLLGGSIQVDSKKNIGTTMTFTLPKKYSIN
ncbi:MAG: HAMP domain-containing sensor histidine kinase, partial [Ignavibacteriaceae bacterium]